ncbi:hypothetical protein SSE37_15588, partial [Sagittula stellata E-37]
PGPLPRYLRQDEGAALLWVLADRQRDVLGAVRLML